MLQTCLEGVRVLELGSTIAGPSAARHLADLGASVRKVEPPSGDQLRTWGTLAPDGSSWWFKSHNRNKQLLVFDIRKPDDAARVRTMALDSDIVIENGRKLAAHVLEAAVSDIEFSRGRFSIAGTDRGIGILELAGKLNEALDLPDEMPQTMDASIVFAATIESRRSVPARVEPALKPNHPKARMIVPTMAMGTLCPGIGRGRPLASKRPLRGPIFLHVTNASTPPVMCTTLEPAKSTVPWPSPNSLPRVESQPPPQTQLP